MARTHAQHALEHALHREGTHRREPAQFLQRHDPVDMPVEVVAQPPHRLRLSMLACRMTAPARTVTRGHRRIRIREEAHVLPRRSPARATRTAKNARRLHRIHKLSVHRRIPRLHLKPSLLTIEPGIKRGLHLHYLRCRWNHLYRRHVSILRSSERWRAPVLAVEVRKCGVSVSPEFPRRQAGSDDDPSGSGLVHFPRSPPRG